jgi:hypothetical protein
MLHLQGEKVFICRLVEVLNPQITKRLGPQIAKFYICERSANLTNCLIPPTFGLHTCTIVHGYPLLNVTSYSSNLIFVLDAQ